MKKLTIEFNKELPDINIIPGKCSDCPFFMSRSHVVNGKEEFEYICILSGDHIDEDIYYYRNIKCSTCPIKEVNHMTNGEKMKEIFDSVTMTDKHKEVVRAMTDESKDNINPNHYKSETSLECIEAMQIAFGNESVIDFCLCNAWKYIWRWKNKNGIEDLKKAEWYVDKGRELLGGDNYQFESTNIYQRFDSMSDYINSHLYPKLWEAKEDD